MQDASRKDGRSQELGKTRRGNWPCPRAAAAPEVPGEEAMLQQLQDQRGGLGKPGRGPGPWGSCFILPEELDSTFGSMGCGEGKVAYDSPGPLACRAEQTLAFR